MTMRGLFNINNNLLKFKTTPSYKLFEIQKLLNLDLLKEVKMQNFQNNYACQIYNNNPRLTKTLHRSHNRLVLMTRPHSKLIRNNQINLQLPGPTTRLNLGRELVMSNLKVNLLHPLKLIIQMLMIMC